MSLTKVYSKSIENIRILGWMLLCIKTVQVIARSFSSSCLFIIRVCKIFPSWKKPLFHHAVNIYLFKVNNRNTRKACICLLGSLFPDFKKGMYLFLAERVAGLFNGLLIVGLRMWHTNVKQLLGFFSWSSNKTVHYNKLKLFLVQNQIEMRLVKPMT